MRVIASRSGDSTGLIDDPVAHWRPVIETGGVALEQARQARRAVSSAEAFGLPFDREDEAKLKSLGHIVVAADPDKATVLRLLEVVGIRRHSTGKHNERTTG